MAEQGPSSNDDILIDAPDGTRLAFPSSMSMDEIKGVMRRKYGAQRSATPAPQFGAGTPSAPASFQQPLRPMSTPMNGTAGGVS